MKLSKLSPVLIVDEIEPCLDFWVGRLGFARTVEVPHEGRLGFVILERDGIEVMYQSRASFAADAPAVARLPAGHSIGLYFEVDDLDAIVARLDGVETLVPRRTTFYGSAEVFVREPSGQVVGFAQPGVATEA